MNNTNIKARMNKLEYNHFKKLHNKPHLHNWSLEFTSEDIRYIILKDSNEILDFISFLESQSSLCLNKNKLEILKTKITTSEMINEDI